MKLLVMGSGGVGGYYGARFAEAGHEVVFVARGRHKDAIAAQGLRVESERGDATIRPATVTDDPAAAGVCDIVLICTKLWDLPAAAEAVRPAVGAETGVIALQNGVDKEQALIDALGPEPVMGGTTQIAAAIAAPGVIRHTGTMATLIYGELDGRDSERLRRFDAAAQAAPGFEARRSGNVRLETWKKFAFLAPFAGATAVYRSSIGPIRNDAKKRALLESLLAETVAVGRAAGIPYGPDREAEVMAFVDGLPEAMKSSMLHDIEAGRRTELDWLTGAVVRLGREHGVPTPRSAEVHAALAPVKDGET